MKIMDNNGKRLCDLRPRLQDSCPDHRMNALVQRRHNHATFIYVLRAIRSNVLDRRTNRVNDGAIVYACG
jgi:hypothetical protein